MTEIFSSIIVSFWVSIHSIDWSYDFFGVKEIEFKNQSSRRFKGTAATYHLSKISTSEDCRLLFITCIALLLLFSTLMGACEQKLHSMVNHTTHLLAAHQVRLKKKKEELWIPAAIRQHLEPQILVAVNLKIPRFHLFLSFFYSLENFFLGWRE